MQVVLLLNKEGLVNKEIALAIIELLSDVESWSYSAKERMSDYLLNQVAATIEQLSEEVLK